VKILLVEDNGVLADWLVRNLREYRLNADTLTTAQQAEQVLLTETYDVLLLDLMLPGMSGSDLLRRLRERGNTTPAIVLTATGSIDEKVRCLGLGADDYLVKPVEIRELVARIGAVARRRQHAAPVSIHCGDLIFDGATRQFLVGGQPVSLPAREHSVLEILISRQGRTVSKQALMNGLFSLNDEPSQDAIEIYVHRLRKRLEKSSASILTLRGLGYLLKPRDDGVLP